MSASYLHHLTSSFPSSIVDRDSIVSSNSIFIPLWLRDTYACVHSSPIYHMNGLLSPPPLSDETDTPSPPPPQNILNIINSIGSSSSPNNLFLSGSDIFPFLQRHHICSGFVTIVITSLRDLYWSNKSSLPSSELPSLSQSTHQPLPSFRNIIDLYPSITSHSSSPELSNIPLYQLFGSISPFSVIHIPVSYFISILNAKLPLQISLLHTNIILHLDYQQFDFWDPISNSLVDHINLSSC